MSMRIIFTFPNEALQYSYPFSLCEGENLSIMSLNAFIRSSLDMSVVAFPDKTILSYSVVKALETRCVLPVMQNETLLFAAMFSSFRPSGAQCI